MRDYTRYEIWNDAVDFAVQVYDQTKAFPDAEKFGLISQLRRASVSISSNFAEGCSRSSEKDFCRFVKISLGSAFEVKTQLIIANRLNFLNNANFNKCLDSIDKMSKQLNTLRTKLKK